jgi:hypothetical protein
MDLGQVMPPIFYAMSKIFRVTQNIIVHKFVLATTQTRSGATIAIYLAQN